MLGPYFRDYSPLKIPPKLGPLDSAGVPMFSLEKLNLGHGNVYHPTVIVQYGLAQYEVFLRGNAEAFKSALKCAEWLEQHAEWDNQHRFRGWPIPFPIKFPAVPAGWWSGLTQGQVISLLLRVNSVQKSESREKIIHDAVKAFLSPVSEGGLITHLKSGHLFIEEAAHLPAIQILNGCLAGLFGLHEYLSVYKDDKVREVFDLSLQGVENLLPQYDCGWWSLYSLGLRCHWADEYYHGVHIEQLETLGKIWSRPKMLEMAARWKTYEKSKFNLFRLKLSCFVGKVLSGISQLIHRPDFMHR